MENVNSQNKKLIIIVGALLLVVGISFAYFIASTLINGNGSSSSITTARIKGAELKVEGTLEFNDTDIYPGHKNVSAIKVTATGNNQLIPYHLVWKGESGISQINYTVYKSSTSQSISSNCTKKTGVVNGRQTLSEECTISNIDTLGSAIANGSISRGDAKEILAQDEFITATASGTSMYYYVVLEYPNLDEDQSDDANATFNGEVTVEESNKEADINILAVYIADDSGNYQETTDIPQSGYVLSEKSTCSNDASVRMEAGELITSNLTKSGTSCYLYFNKLKTVNTVLGNIQVNPEVKTKFDKTATTDEGIQQAEDGMYGGTSYYWRGAVTNNYLKFAGFCWRIVRINGDGSIRLIYDGATCHANEVPDSGSMTILNQAYNPANGRSENVGYTYEEGSQRPSDNASGTASNLKTQIDSWYNEYLLEYRDKIADGKYCNDRETTSGDSWSSQPTNSFSYAAYGRLKINKTPSLNCSSSDIYTLKAGTITADEVVFAGGRRDISNSNFYLYNGRENCWTMTPNSWDSLNGRVGVLVLYADGTLSIATVDYTPGISIRPVINLRSDITISSGNGTLNNPYIVAD